MDLYSGTPYWLVKNPLWNYYRPLRDDLKIEAVVIGGGITGALAAHALVKAGVECCIVDKRSPATASSCASTALLQYEIDLPLCRMSRLMPEEDAAAAYRACLDAVGELEELLHETGTQAGFRRVPSLFYASDPGGLQLIREELAMRRRHGLPVEYLDRKRLGEVMGFDAPGALMNSASAQVDACRAAVGLMRHDMEHAGLRLFSHTEIVRWQRCGEGYVLTAGNGCRIECDYLIVAAGFEAGPFLPQRLMRLTTTFAVASEPVDERLLWSGRSLIWETRSPYLYIRTDDNNRIIAGGEDIGRNSAVLRRMLLPHKAAVLRRKFRRLFPHIPFTAELAWAGTFSTTRDGLPLIGAFDGAPRMLFALGYGGNGITFSVIAARTVARAVTGEADPQRHLFTPERASLRR